MAAGLLDYFWPEYTAARERGAFKDELAKTDDKGNLVTDINDPATLQKLIAIAPTEGMGLVDRMGAINDQRRKLSAERLTFADTANNAAADKYTELTRGTLGEDGQYHGGGMSHVDALKGANALYQQYLLHGARYGKGFVDGTMAPAWDLDTAQTYGEMYQKLGASMKEDKQVMFTNPDGTRRVESVRRLPNEWDDFLKDNPGAILLKQGENAPVSVSPGGGGPLAPQVKSTGEVIPNPRAEAVHKYAAEIKDHPAIKDFSGIQDALGVARKAVEVNDPADDYSLVVKWASAHNHGAQATEGSVQAAAQASGISNAAYAVLRNVFNGDKMSKLDPTLRKSIYADLQHLQENAAPAFDRAIGGLQYRSGREGVDWKDLEGGYIDRRQEFKDNPPKIKHETSEPPAGVKTGPGAQAAEAAAVLEGAVPVGKTKLKSGKTFTIKKR